MKVYLDMDGVLADFFSEAVKLADCEHKKWRDMEFRDIQRTLDRISKHEKKFFARLKPFPGTKTFVQCVQNIAGGFSILSSPLSGYEGCAEEKTEWLSQHLHLDPKEIIITSNKNQYASGNILIDDYGYNIRRWEEHGGFGIKYQADEQHMSDALTPLSLMFKAPL